MQPDSRPGSVGAELLGCLLTGLQLATLVLYLLLSPGRISEKDRKTDGLVLGYVIETVMEDMEWKGAGRERFSV